jgi:hypothetical protein
MLLQIVENCIGKLPVIGMFPNEPTAGAIPAIDGTAQGGKEKHLIGIGVNKAGHRAVSRLAERIYQLSGQWRTIIQYFNGTAERMIRPEGIKKFRIIRRNLYVFNHG